jgi:2-deoxy-D-gluconate 3-dehydrogenase
MRENPMNLFDLKGKVAVITGGNGGIGLGMAQGIASCGACIVIAGRDQEKAVVALKSLHDMGAEASFIAADVTRKADCVALIASTVEKYGRVDILVNNAGTSVRKMPQDLSEDEWHHVLDTNLTSAFFCSQATYPEMVKAGGGKMINIGSMMSLFGAPYATAYASSKGGIVQMSRAMATAWAKDNIQVNAVLPGWIDTDLTKRARQQVDGLHDSVQKRTPHGRWGTPDDMAGVAAFLAGPASDFVTGAAIPVDGGFSIGM